jgi:hypothetical protein
MSMSHVPVSHRQWSFSVGLLSAAVIPGDRRLGRRTDRFGP